MLTLLRKIRRSLLRSGNFKKYSLYAIGEITLIVIGILIALSINNWSDWKKDRIKEKIILHDVAKNIEINIQYFRENADRLQRNNRSGEIVLSALQNRIPFADSLKQHFHRARITKQQLFVSDVGYQALKDLGPEILTNRSLAEEIINLYEVSIPQILSTNNLVNQTYQTFDNHLVQHFELTAGEGLNPYDYKGLFSDDYYINWIKAYKEGRKYLIYADNELITECERVLQLVKDELERSNE